ncbi:MAG: tRNA lysidine(34) synthetase TilS [Verrucomicrobiota bacterium]
MNWPTIAAAFAAQLPAGRLHPAALARLRAAFATDARIAIALSGGADSLALLLLLHAHAPTSAARRRLVALHFNHRLRGAAATADARFCQRVCAALGIPLALGEWTDRPARKTAASEAAARTARHAFFDRELRRRRIHLLCLGHHQDDVAETVFMRLARGAGTAGLAAPRPVQSMPGERVHLRPLLTLAHAEITDALTAAGATWREDATNATDAHFRNRVRRHLLPALIEAAGRDAIAGAALSRELLDEDDAALEAWSDAATRLDDTGRLQLPVPPATLPRAVLRRVLRRWLNHHGVGEHLSRQGFGTILALAENGRPGRVSLDATRLVVLRKHRLSIENAPVRRPAKARPAN